MTSCCHRRRMRWSGATGAIARCKNRSTGYARKPRSVHAWRWTCGEKPKAKGANKPSTPYMRHVLAEATRYPCYSLRFSHHNGSGDEKKEARTDRVRISVPSHAKIDLLPRYAPLTDSLPDY